ncbi:MAG: NAD(+)/NADH kinase [Eubacterium sp.]|nr:NAD(+)/NADH kinase [Eubacterium sp.]
MEDSIRIEKDVRIELAEAGFSVMDEYDDKSCDLIVCIGGDGAFLNLIHELDFPDAPIIGINTGHLGFFQEIEPEQTHEFMTNYIAGNYQEQSISAVDIVITCGGRKYRETGLNEVVVKGTVGCNVHLNMSIGGSFIETFTGDGILVSTPAGSTAYNYSLGGSIVDPRLRLLQVTPLAPINTVAYRSFTSSLMLPAGSALGLVPEHAPAPDIHIEFDGFSKDYHNVSEMKVKLSRKCVKLLRLETYDFWSKVKSKFL